MKKSLPSILEPFVDANGNITTVWYKFLTLYSPEATGGVSNYNDLTNLPSIENKKIQGNLTLDYLNIQKKLIPGINITIDENNKINAKEYKPGENIEITEDGVINATTEGGLGRFEVGDIGISPFVDEGKNLRRYLNGQVILQSQFAGFTTKLKKAVQTYPNLATTEDNWQAIKSNSKIGQVGKFVIDDTAGTIRLPCIVKLQGVLNLGNIGDIVDDGLPTHTHTRGDMNITGTLGALPGWAGYASYTNGAFTNPKILETANTWGSTDGSRVTYDFDASKSWTGNTSTGNYSSDLATTNTVQEEAIQYPYFIQVANGVVEEIDVSTEIQLNNPFSLGDYKWSQTEIENLSWLKSDGASKDGTLYTSYYNWILANANAGKELFKFSTDTYTDYDWVINTADNTFRLPILSGDEEWVGNENIILSTADVTADNPFVWAANKNGYVYFTGYAERETQVLIVFVNGVPLYHSGASLGNVEISIRPGSWVKVKKGDVVTIKAESTTIKNINIGFVPAVGNGSLYFYVGETVQDANLINAANIANNKLNTDLSNVTNDGKSLISGLGMPSGKYTNLTLGASDSEYTAPANGWFTVRKRCKASGQFISFFIPENRLNVKGIGVGSADILELFIQVSKGQVLKTDYTASGTTSYFRFIYAEGDNID